MEINSTKQMRCNSRIEKMLTNLQDHYAVRARFPIFDYFCLINSYEVLQKAISKIFKSIRSVNMRPIQMLFSGLISLLISGIVSLILGILTIEFPIYEVLLSERTKMTPGLPPYELWLNPQPEIRLSTYVFTVQNAEAFLNGTDAKLNLKEVGPIVYRENLHHEDVVFHENNSTMSYTAVRSANYLEDANKPGILNRTIIVPNFALLVCGILL